MRHPVRLALFCVLALSACGPARVPQARGPMVVDGVSYDVVRKPSQALLVTRQGRPFQNWEGAEARRAADAFCVGRAKTGLRDRFQGEGWLIVEGCA